MFADEPAHGRRTEQAAFAQPGFRKKVLDHLAQFVGEPVIDWRGKAGFWLTQHFGRKDISHRFAKDVLCDRTEKSLQFEFEARRYVPGRELGQLTIQKRHANLNRGCPAHVVAVSAIEARDYYFPLEFKHLCEVVFLTTWVASSAILQTSIY